MAGEEDRCASRSRTPLKTVLLAYGLGAVLLLLVVLLWFAADVMLLVFASVLLAVLFDDGAAWIERRLRLPRRAALPLLLAVVIGVLALVGWLIAPQIADQTRQLAADLPQAFQRLRSYLERNGVLADIAAHLPSPRQLMPSTDDVAQQAGGAVTRVFGGLGNVVVVMFVSIYLAAQPGVYLRGIVILLPPKRRERGRAVLKTLGETLRLWLRGKLISMAVIGVMTAIGLAALGIPLALALGLVAGLLDFIPYIGPLLAAVPAVLIAFSQEPTLALYAALLFFGLQLLEGYLLLPLVERRTVSLPPALTITMQVVMGVSFGLIGIALATPLTAVLAVLIAMLYVEDVLGDQVKLPSAEH
jgi:predicted PurR-regulated permease PerM